MYLSNLYLIYDAADPDTLIVAGSGQFCRIRFSFISRIWICLKMLNIEIKTGVIHSKTFLPTNPNAHNWEFTEYSYRTRISATFSVLLSMAFLVGSALVLIKKIFFCHLPRKLYEGLYKLKKSKLVKSAPVPARKVWLCFA